MSNGAHSVHKYLRSELENYIISQYFGKSPILLDAIKAHIDDEGLLYRRPYIESTPAYITVPNGLKKLNVPDWLRDFFINLADSGLNVYKTPFLHQMKALEAFVCNQDLFVATGTGSGKTECFMWPMIAKIVEEAKNSPESWALRGTRVIVMYPMNALVSDQIGRLRRLIGDPEEKFVNVFRKTCGEQSRRPQFGMYTGRTPYPGPEPSATNDRDLEKTLRTLTMPEDESRLPYYNRLLKEGKIPAKKNMESFLSKLRTHSHIPDEEDAELITRFEMQQFCPDILITNYSMLEYMLLRPREAKIWEDTKHWLAQDADNKLLFVIDEAHMYRGSSGGEVALLIRRLFHKLGIGRDRVQFILTTASMPDASSEDRDAVMKYANDLTAADEEHEFSYFTGDREVLSEKALYDISSERIANSDPSEFESDDKQKLVALNSFWNGIDGFNRRFNNLDDVYEWMFNNILSYRPFHELIKHCRGDSVSIDVLAERLFPELNGDKALNAVSVLLAIAPLARDKEGMVLFPARMHMLFTGIKGVYACTNPNCSHSHADNRLSIGEVYLSDDQLTCPYCNSVVYELYNDRRCGALFYKGYILADEIKNPGYSYLWHYSGQYIDPSMKEIHLFIPSDDYQAPKKQGKNPIKACYMDVHSGFIFFYDDAHDRNPSFRKLYYSTYVSKSDLNALSFSTCPHCMRALSSSKLTSFSTRGNQSFYNLIKAQFQSQPAVSGKDDDIDRLPNEGRKVLLFSDSRQRAAKLARDMSDASDIMAARQLFSLAVREMEKNKENLSMNSLYDYFCLMAAENHVHIFHDAEREKFEENCKTAASNHRRAVKRNLPYSPRFNVENAPRKMQEYLLALYSGGYNTLYDSATSWIEPTATALYEAVDDLEENGIVIDEQDFIELFNAWFISVCEQETAIGHTIPNSVRTNVRSNYDGYGLDPNWRFPRHICEIMGWEYGNQPMTWIRTLKNTFMDVGQHDNSRMFIDLTRIRPRFDVDKEWFKCERCAGITPYRLKKKCPICGSDKIHEMSQAEYNSLNFWRKPVEDALNGDRIRVIDTEEHTAQLSHKDQRDDMWSKTEKYELRFQDLISDDETPVDILSSTTTMEVGIDIGSLVAVGLRNIPPMRENYQQRAGRAGRRGSSLSTIVTFCEGGPHDTLYFNNPEPMFRGDPRRPWIDLNSAKLLQRHYTMVVLQEYLSKKNSSLDIISAIEFLDENIEDFVEYVRSYSSSEDTVLLPQNCSLDKYEHLNGLIASLKALKHKRDEHPELFEESGNGVSKFLLDSLYEEGIIPTYSFPKSVVSTYITDSYGKTKYEVERGLDVAIGEYAPGRSIVVDKQTFQIGGLYYPGSERKAGKLLSPASSYFNDHNYIKRVIKCNNCNWFGLEEDHNTICPFCGSDQLEETKEMVRPWGFAPRDGKSISDKQLVEDYSGVQEPLYSTVPDSDDISSIKGYSRIRIASRSNQRIIMINKGVESKGFVVCEDCGAAMPGENPKVLDSVSRPYNNRLATSRCRHSNVRYVNLGYDFVTDMMVLEIELDPNLIDVHTGYNPWIDMGAQSLAEALRLAASKELDIEFSELVTGYRLRKNKVGAFVDVYLYDSLSSGAGYSYAVSESIETILKQVMDMLGSCSCESSCYKCLKHYRNQFVHGRLDRFAAIQMLKWGKEGAMADKLDYEAQRNLVSSLCSILSYQGIELDYCNNDIFVVRNGIRKRLVVYPAMWKEPVDQNTIYVSDFLIKNAKPYAVKKISTNV